MTMYERMEDFMLSNGIQSSLSECPKIKLVVEGTKHLSLWYKPPNRRIVIGPLLDANHDVIDNK